MINGMLSPLSLVQWSTKLESKAKILAFEKKYNITRFLVGLITVVALGCIALGILALKNQIPQIGETYAWLSIVLGSSALAGLSTHIYYLVKAALNLKTAKEATASR